MDFKDYYKILGVKADADLNMIEQLEKRHSENKALRQQLGRFILD